MIFDPVKNVWIGNESELTKFRNGPTLIQPKKQTDQVEVVGDMVFDPVEKVWKGNDKALEKFKGANRPALITQLHNANERIEKKRNDF